jgi:maltose alpha-D-glucosyltransferase/alpha-amylase
MAFLFTMPGVPLVYYGDEIGMRYISGLPNKEGSMVTRGNRAGSRTPMQWNRTTNAGFSAAASEKLYLSIDTLANYPTVEYQRRNPNSLLNFTREMLKLRAKYPALASRGDVDFLTTQEKAYPLVYTRGKDGHQFLVIVNPSGKPQTIRVDNKYRISKITPVLVVRTGVTVRDDTIEITTQPTSYGIYLIK